MVGEGVEVEGFEEGAEGIAGELAGGEVDAGGGDALVVGVLDDLADEGVERMLEDMLGGIAAAARAGGRQRVEDPGGWADRRHAASLAAGAVGETRSRRVEWSRNS